MFKYILNVVTGTFAHWNTTNNVSLNNISSKIDKLDEFNLQVFRKFLACSSLVVDDLLGPNRKQTSISSIKRSDVKSLTLQDFNMIYKEFIRMYAILFSSLNRV